MAFRDIPVKTMVLEKDQVGTELVIYVIFVVGGTTEDNAERVRATANLNIDAHIVGQVITSILIAIDGNVIIQVTTAVVPVIIAETKLYQ